MPAKKEPTENVGAGSGEAEASDKNVQELKNETPLDDGRNISAANNDIGPSGEQQAPPPPTPDTEGLSEDEKKYAEEVHNHPTAKFGEKVVEASEKEQEEFKKEQEENSN